MNQLIKCIKRRGQRFGAIAQLGWLLAFMLIYLALVNFRTFFKSSDYVQDVTGVSLVRRQSAQTWVAAQDRHLLFIGGHPRSGTTLMRVLLDSHPAVRCGPETHILPKLLQLYQQVNTPFERTRLQMAGIGHKLLHTVFRNFMLDIIVHHANKTGQHASDPSQLLCNKDPFLLNNAVVIKRLFHNAKFICMIRDGRAVVHSVVDRKVTIGGFNLSNFEDCLKKWNTITQNMIYQCDSLGNACLKVYYEKLALDPKLWLKRVFRFLNLPWDDSVLRHHELIADGAINLSPLERSTEQVIKPINPSALTNWVGKIPENLLANMSIIAPMLTVLGYDPDQNPPDYGKMDDFVRHNMQLIKQQEKQWSEKSQHIEKQRSKLRANIALLSEQFRDISQLDSIGKEVDALLLNSSKIH